MDQKLTSEFSQAIKAMIDTEKASHEARETVELLRRRWNAELRVGDVVGHRYDGKCEVVSIANDTIEVKALDVDRRTISETRKESPIHRAELYPWTDAYEAKHQLNLRRKALVNRFYDLPDADIPRIEETLGVK